MITRGKLLEKITIRLLLGVLLLMILVNIILPGRLKDFEIDFLNVGQGDSILLRNDSLVLLVDVGRDESVTQRLGEILSSYERDIDYVILTHFDEDHIGGLETLVEQYNIGKILIENKKDPKFEDVRKLADQKNIEIVQVCAGDYITNGELEMYFLWPEIGTDIDIEERNTRSIVMLASYKKFDVLLTGDLDIKGEEQLMEDWVGIESEVLKLGHHGSKTSTSQKFLDIVNPNLAVVSAGKNNHYGHPSPEVISRLRTKNTRIFYTYGGNISIVTDGYKYWIAK